MSVSYQLELFEPTEDSLKEKCPNQCDPLNDEDNGVINLIAEDYRPNNCVDGRTKQPLIQSKFVAKDVGSETCFDFFSLADALKGVAPVVEESARDTQRRKKNPDSINFEKSDFIGITRTLSGSWKVLFPGGKSQTVRSEKEAVILYIEKATEAMQNSQNVNLQKFGVYKNSVLRNLSLAKDKKKDWYDELEKSIPDTLRAHFFSGAPVN